MRLARHRRSTMAPSTRRKIQLAAAGAAVVATVAAATPSIATPQYSSFWSGSGSTSAARAVDMSVPINVGTRFRAAATGRVSGLHLYLQAAPLTMSTARLYNAGGTLVGSTRFAGSTRTGWRDVRFAKPVTVPAGGVVTAVVDLPNGHWIYSSSQLGTAQRNGDLTALGSYYAFSSRPVLPTKRTRDALFVDLMFTRVAPAGATPTATASTATASSSTAVATAAARPTTAAPTATSATTAASTAQIGACAIKPNATNTGATGSLASSGVSTISANGTVLQNVSTGSLTVMGSDVTIHNVKVNGTLHVRGDRVKVDHVTANGISISGGSNDVIQYSNMSGGNDASDVTSDTGRATNALLQYNYIHNPNPAPMAHYDGTQVRGVDGLKILCSNYDLGAWQSTYNSAVYMENANGGTNNVTVANNWLNGGGITLYVTATNLTVTGNKFGRAYHWAPCRNLGAKFASSGNSWMDTGAAFTPCG